MKRPNITPGSWHVGTNPGPIVYGQKGEQVTGWNALLEDGENQANCQAIAALPDLLAALEAALSLLECANDHQREAGRLEYDTQTAKNALIKAGYTFNE